MNSINAIRKIKYLIVIIVICSTSSFANAEKIYLVTNDSSRRPRKELSPEQIKNICQVPGNYCNQSLDGSFVGDWLDWKSEVILSGGGNWEFDWYGDGSHWRQWTSEFE